MNYEFHPLANIFPLIEGQAYQDLMADVMKNGVREPVWLYEGQILDGRNRYRAASAMGVDCPVREYDGEDAIAFVISLNLHRRHLSESQRAAVAAKLANMSLGDNKGAHRPTQEGSANLQTLSSSVSQSDAAEMLNVSPRSVATAKKVQEAAPEVFEQVERGNISVNLAAQVAELPVVEREEVQEAIAAQPEQAKTIAREAVRAHVANNSGNNEWYTPPNFIEAAREAMGGIHTDPASCAIANRTVKAETYFDAEVNGLAQEWAGNVWMNPPYAQPLISDFCEALAIKYASGEVDQACVLVNNGTETGWFQTLLSQASAVCFIKTRVKFLDPEGNPSGAPLQGQAIVYMGDEKDRFADSFCRFGKVLYS